jgi:hypothetical protein
MHAAPSSRAPDAGSMVYHQAPVALLLGSPWPSLRPRALSMLCSRWRFWLPIHTLSLLSQEPGLPHYLKALPTVSTSRPVRFHTHFSHQCSCTSLPTLVSAFPKPELTQVKVGLPLKWTHVPVSCAGQQTTLEQQKRNVMRRVPSLPQSQRPTLSLMPRYRNWEDIYHGHLEASLGRGL